MINGDEWRGPSEVPWTPAEDLALDMALEVSPTAASLVREFERLGLGQHLIRDLPQRSAAEVVERIRQRGIAVGPVMMSALQAIAKPPAVSIFATKPQGAAPALRVVSAPPPPQGTPDRPKEQTVPPTKEVLMPDDEWQTADAIAGSINRDQKTIYKWAARGLVRRKSTGNPNLKSAQWLFSVKDCKRVARSLGRRGGRVMPIPGATPTHPQPVPRSRRTETTALEAHVWAERDLGNITDAQALDMLRALRGKR